MTTLLLFRHRISGAGGRVQRPSAPHHVPRDRRSRGPWLFRMLLRAARFVALRSRRRAVSVSTARSTVTNAPVISNTAGRSRRAAVLNVGSRSRLLAQRASARIASSVHAGVSRPLSISATGRPSVPERRHATPPPIRVDTRPVKGAPSGSWPSASTASSVRRTVSGNGSVEHRRAWWPSARWRRNGTRSNEVRHRPSASTPRSSSHAINGAASYVVSRPSRPRWGSGTRARRPWITSFRSRVAARIPTRTFSVRACHAI